MGKQLSLIVAATPSGGIGIRGGLPWRLPTDMAFFKALTLGASSTKATNAVIMGRHTWESIPAKFRPLAGRVNVIISSTRTADELGVPQSANPSVFVAKSLDDALEKLDANDTFAGEIFIIGGSRLYHESLAHARIGNVFLTRLLECDIECDVSLGKDFPDSQRFGQCTDEEVRNEFNTRTGKDIEQVIGSGSDSLKRTENGLEFEFQLFKRI
ncbi:hypothetical protein GQ42DRAFT_160346 [Ramicandelaber brevisporus]|nr:hypothetical protein GQ42DRAFT_160346 [Ramicandelaber brevisporus]